MSEPIASSYSSTTHGQPEANASGVSWSAVFAGAFVTAALVLILLALGAGLGLSSVSPWSNTGVSASGIGHSAIMWLIVMEILSSAMGGYLAGRLRTKWTSVHTDEVYFRDTAHGFLAWSTALVVTAAFLATAATTMVGASVSSKGDAEKVSGSAYSSFAYFVDSLFRNSGAKTDPVGNAIRSEVALIFANGLQKGSLPTEDQAYLEQVVSTQTGISPQDAKQRVSNAFTNAQQSADELRKATAHSLLWTFLALLIGAFSASFAATVGGRQRDRVITI
ncbi:hypothetical protein [Terriglobus roseus]|uniref:Uncharacterized protein n=1 Tax=Terriglobus roseus TaxID=392734 RepID=A0A1G7HCN6_9BACT|nr:hypothetical protein [Terriglobus roseus]SDE98227.1 hypothetical protein SAMN05444167_1020 [Terriglobus roseus]